MNQIGQFGINMASQAIFALSYAVGLAWSRKFKRDMYVMLLTVKYQSDLIYHNGITIFLKSNQEDVKHVHQMLRVTWAPGARRTF